MLLLCLPHLLVYGNGFKGQFLVGPEGVRIGGGG